MRGHSYRVQRRRLLVCEEGRDDVGGVKEISPGGSLGFAHRGVVESLRNARRRRASENLRFGNSPGRGINLRGSIDAATRSGSAGQRPIDNQEQNGSQY